MQENLSSETDRTEETTDNQELEELAEDQLIQRLVEQYTPTLKEISPAEGISRYLTHKQPKVTPGTRSDYQRKLNRFKEFLEQQDIDDLRDLTGRTLDNYAQWRRYESCTEVDELSQKTMRDEMYLLRDLIQYLERIEAVKPDLSQTILIPEISGNDGIRNVDMDSKRVKRILEYLKQYEYASLEHVIWLLTARIGRRTGGLTSLDLCDVNLQREDPNLEFRHRPPGTRLKNGNEGEGRVALTEEEADILADYIENNRHDVTAGGRNPLLSTRNGRIAKSTFRRYVYGWSRPCEIGRDCPHDRDPEECEAAQTLDDASKCPSSRSPHVLRHGFITEGLRQGIPIAVLSDRCDASEEVIREYYDESTEAERLDVRRSILDEYTSANGGGYL